jgi:hypothetical protein
VKDREVSGFGGGRDERVGHFTPAVVLGREQPLNVSRSPHVIGTLQAFSSARLVSNQRSLACEAILQYTRNRLIYLQMAKSLGAVTNGNFPFFP